LSAPNTKVIDEDIIFDGRYVVLAWRPISQPNGQVKIDFLLHAKTNLVANDILALHLNNAANNVIDQPGDVMLDKSAKHIPAGTSWIQSSTVTTQRFELSKSIGIAMYKDPAFLFTVRGGRSDWEGKRLLLPK